MLGVHIYKQIFSYFHLNWNTLFDVQIYTQIFSYSHLNWYIDDYYIEYVYIYIQYIHKDLAIFCADVLSATAKMFVIDLL